MQANEHVAAPPRERSWRARVVLWGVGLAAIGVAGFALYVWIALHLSYSSGERVGYMQKFSRKGWVCKTWEGELAMVTMPGVMGEKFFFTVRDDKVAADLNGAVGRRVALHYEQHPGIPTSCFGDTEYFITRVQIAE
jgi:hypothetical protein